MKKIRNRELYDFIIKNYIETENTMRVEDIATLFDLSIGTIKNFMYRHNLNKKQYYQKRKDKIMELLSQGIPVKEVAKMMNMTIPNVYRIRSKKGE